MVKKKDKEVKGKELEAVVPVQSAKVEEERAEVPAVTKLVAAVSAEQVGGSRPLSPADIILIQPGAAQPASDTTAADAQPLQLPGQEGKDALFLVEVPEGPLPFQPSVSIACNSRAVDLLVQRVLGLHISEGVGHAESADMLRASEDFFHAHLMGWPVGQACVQRLLLEAREAVESEARHAITADDIAWRKLRAWEERRMQKASGAHLHAQAGTGDDQPELAVGPVTTASAGDDAHADGAADATSPTGPAASAAGESADEGTRAGAEAAAMNNSS